MQSFPDDCEALLKDLTLPPKSKLLALNPYMGAKWFAAWREIVQGPLAEETRYPVVLDPKHEVMQLVIQYYHLQS